ncbi:MAG: hypothetical protein ABGX82_08390 [Pseudomonas sp.]|uniref:hypothetical protein n=1 Tax=Pseudomonas sp. TaxID=306 RepID=UPI0032427A61
MKNKKKPQKKRIGTCALMGTEGVFAKSHLIPAALTQPEKKGEKFIEAGRGMRPIRRPSSWYDNQLLGHEGEALLAKLDSDGIKILREHKLIWSSWPPKKKTFKFDDYALEPGPPEYMTIRSVNIPPAQAAKLKLFMLSIIWRSLMSRIKSFSHLENIGVDLDEIAKHIKEGTLPPDGTYRISLYQLTTKGYQHNHTPTIQEMTTKKDEVSTSVRFYRVYFDGLIIHFFARNEVPFQNSDPLYIGESENLVVIGRPFENSRQEQDLIHSITTSFQRWPEDAARVGAST